MKIRGISSFSSMRTYKPKSSTPFPFPSSSSSSHQNNNLFPILHSITNITPTITTTTTTHDGDDDAICRFIDPPPSHTEVHDALSSLQR
jgi:carbohydrate-binding DOMON domain-containing protein